MRHPSIPGPKSGDPNFHSPRPEPAVCDKFRLFGNICQVFGAGKFAGVLYGPSNSQRVSVAPLSHNCRPILASGFLYQSGGVVGEGQAAAANDGADSGERCVKSIAVSVVCRAQLGEEVGAEVFREEVQGLLFQIGGDCS